MMDGLVSDIIRPPRTRPSEAKLGPQKDVWERTELTLHNPRGLALACSSLRLPNGKARPTLVYAHGNASNRSGGCDLREFCFHRIECNLFAFDFAGCGDSEGDFISLGFYEQDDLKCVLDHLSSSDEVGPIVLLGRSMGAVSCMMYARKYAGMHPKVCGLVFDGIFESLPILMADLGKQMSPLLGFRPISALGTALIRRACLKKANFDVHDVCAINSDVTLPALFFLARDDELFPREHIERVCAAYGGPKRLVELDGGHNDFRGAAFWNALERFLSQQFQSQNAVASAPSTIVPKEDDDDDDNSFYCQLVPFTGSLDPADGSGLSFDEALIIPGPLRAILHANGVSFVAIYRPGQPTVYSWSFAELQQTVLIDRTHLLLIVGDNSGFMISCPHAATLKQSMDACLTLLLRQQFSTDRPAALARVQLAAEHLMQEGRTAADSPGEAGETAGIMTVDAVVAILAHHLGVSSNNNDNDGGESLLAAIRTAVQQVADNLGPPVVRMT